MDRLQVIDAHVHFWNPARLSYPWLDNEPSLRRPFLPDEYSPFRAGETTGVVFVEANCDPCQGLAEAAYVAELAELEPRIAATVAFVDLLDVAARPVVLDALALSGRVCGIRQNIQGRPAALCREQAFIDGVQAAGERGLTFDLCVTADQLPEVERLVRRCPRTSFALDHCGKPPIRDDGFAQWAEALGSLASCENVSCKISGLLTEARADRRGYHALYPYAAHAVACFGVHRVMYGSDWPVVRLGGGLAAWRRFTDRFTADWSSVDRQAFYVDNAVRFYDLPTHVHI